jgi:hypothetical protein
MRTAIAVALCALALPASALAKGPTEATITGPGLARPLTFGGPGALAPGEPLEVMSTRGGFFEVAFGTSPGRSVDASPTTHLGPKYQVNYLVPDQFGTKDRIRQDLYPFARGGPVTYTPPGQPFFETRTVGGWFRADMRLTNTLVAAGLPRPGRSASPPAPDDGGPAAPIGLWALVGGLLIAAAALGIRRFGRPASV